MQFVFLYYDANRNGRLEVEEVATMLEHINQIRGQVHTDAKVDATALLSLYQGPFGFAAFYDASQRRMLNGTSPLLRTTQDICDVIRQYSAGGGGSSPSSSTTASTASNLKLASGCAAVAPSAGSAAAYGQSNWKMQQGLAAMSSAGQHLAEQQPRPTRGRSVSREAHAADGQSDSTAAGPGGAPALAVRGAGLSQNTLAATQGLHEARLPLPPVPLSQLGTSTGSALGSVGSLSLRVNSGSAASGLAPKGGRSAALPSFARLPQDSSQLQQTGDVSALALRVVRRLMELSSGPRTDWRCGLELVSAREMLQLCDTVVETLRAEDSLVTVRLPCRVYGDIHGQLLDLLEFFNAFSWPDKRRGDIFSMNYIFLGDFVDRGNYSCDVVALLFSLKILYPYKIFLIRGNHEDRLMNVNYGFHDDCARKYGRDGTEVWERVNDVFEFLPLAALVADAIFCIHGGIGDTINSLDDLRNIPKPIQVVGDVTASTARQERVVLDALWSDPTDNDDVMGVHESPRGKNTCRFGPDRVQEFNRRNGIKLIIRAHECVKQGYEYFAAGQLLTVFSATNYCNQFNNDGAMIVLVRDEQTGEIVEHAQVIKSGTVDTSGGWNEQQFRAPSPMRRAGEGMGRDSVPAW